MMRTRETTSCGVSKDIHCNSNATLTSMTAETAPVAHITGTDVAISEMAAATPTNVVKSYETVQLTTT